LVGWLVDVFLYYKESDSNRKFHTFEIIGWGSTKHSYVRRFVHQYEIHLPAHVINRQVIFTLIIITHFMCSYSDI